MPNYSQDPFYLVRQDIQDSINELQQRMSRFHGLLASNPERKSIAQEVESACESLKWQLNELNNALDRAEENPQRFNIPPDELNSRRKWVQNTKRQVEGLVTSLKTATAAAPQQAAAENRFIDKNEKFVRSQNEQQSLIMRQQDEQLGDIEQGVTRLMEVGVAIKDELNAQEGMLSELDDEVDHTTNRLKAAQKKMREVIKASGTTTQLMVIAFLMVLLIILVVLAFM